MGACSARRTEIILGVFSGAPTAGTPADTPLVVDSGVLDSGAVPAALGRGESVSNAGADAGRDPSTSPLPDAGDSHAAGNFAMTAGQGAMSGATAGSAAAPQSGRGGGAPAPAPSDKTCLRPGNGNYTEPGPYRVITKDVDLGTIDVAQHTGKFTIYIPDPLEDECLHPIAAWGNGTAVSDSDFTYDFLNRNAASWGIVVASSAEDNVGSGKFHRAGVEYLLKANMDSSSPFFGKLSTRVGLSGHDAGGYGASVAATLAGVEAIVAEGATIRSTDTVSVLILTGTHDLVPPPENLVKTALGHMFVASWEGGTREGTETTLGYMGLDNGTGDAKASQRGSLQFQRLYAAWFRCFLASDDVACRLFSGGAPSGCGICKDPGWHSLASSNL